jgi:hypothetical protein
MVFVSSLNLEQRQYGRPPDRVKLETRIIYELGKTYVILRD